MAVEEEELGHVILEVDDDFSPGISGERVWAKDLGEDLWEIRNTPWHTCEVAFRDVVLAKSDAPDHWPTFVKVVRPGGHKTLQIYFLDGVTDEARDSVLKKINEQKASAEGADGRFYALDLEPGGDINALVAVLDGMKQAGILDFRTMVRAEADA